LYRDISQKAREISNILHKKDELLYCFVPKNETNGQLVGIRVRKRLKRCTGFGAKMYAALNACGYIHHKDEQAHGFVPRKEKMV